MDRAAYNIKKTVRDWFRELLELMFAAAALIIDTLSLKVNAPALTVCQNTVVKYLQKHIEHVGVCLFNLIEKYNGVRFSSYL